MNAILVLIGAMFGSVLRYALTFVEALIIKSFTSGPKTVQFPWATTMANLAGSFGAGLLIRLFGSAIDPTSTALVTLLVLGFCGALSTMSTFIFEVLVLIRQKAPVIAFGYLFFGVGMSLLMFWFGMVTGTIFNL